MARTSQGQAFEKATITKGILMLILVALCWGLSGCTSPDQQSSVADDFAKQWLQGTPCKAPCWEGITPGKTTVDEAVALLKVSPIVNPNSVGVDRDPAGDSGTVYWAWKGDPDSIQDGTATFVSGITSEIIQVIHPFFLPTKKTSFTLEDVIQVYGTPTYVSAYVCTSRATNERIYSAGLIYDAQGFGVGTFNGFSEKPFIDKDLRLDEVTFFAPLSSNTNKGLKPWQGFNSFDSYETKPYCG